jgi:hypothetical protein
LYALTYVINVGLIDRLDYLKLIKLGREPVAESTTPDILV